MTIGKLRFEASKVTLSLVALEIKNWNTFISLFSTKTTLPLTKHPENRGLYLEETKATLTITEYAFFEYITFESSTCRKRHVLRRSKDAIVAGVTRVSGNVASAISTRVWTHPYGRCSAGHIILPRGLDGRLEHRDEERAVKRGPEEK